MQLLASAIVILLSASVPAHAIEQCGSGKRHTCVVDGDTIWLRGEKIRIQAMTRPKQQRISVVAEPKSNSAKKPQSA